MKQSLGFLDKTEPFIIYGPEETRTFCYITDVVRAMRLLTDAPATNNQPIETVHIGNIDEIAMLELAKKMFKVAGWIPDKLEFKPSPAGSVKRRLADISKIQKLVGWTPEVSLEDGLRRTFEWYKRQ